MSNSNPTFGTTVPAYFLGRPRSVYRAVYQAQRKASAEVVALPEARELSQAA